MKIHIPTKKEFDEDINAFFEKLYTYLSHKLSGDMLSDVVYKLINDTSSLEDFFKKHGEIENNENAFLSFCKEDIKKSSITIKKKKFSEDDEYNEKDIDNSVGEEDIYDIESEPSMQNLLVPIFEKLFNHIKTLPEKEQAKFKVAFISIQNRLDTDAKKSPSDMPKQVHDKLDKLGKKLGDIITKGMTYSKRRFELEKILHPSGFWQYYLKEIGVQLLAKDSSKQKEIYKKYYRQAKFSNITRDKEKMASIVNILSNEDNIDKFKEELYKDIKNFPLNKTLDDIPEEAKTLRDKVLKGFKMTACPEYSATIATYLMHQLDRNHPIDFEDNVKKYLEHRRTCKRCRSCEEKLSKGLEYRIDRIKMKTPETYSYGYHYPTEEKIQLTKEKDLVRYYEREYRNNPCDLNYYYLILSYKIAGLEDKAKQLLNETKNIPEYKNIQRTKIATQIKGD